MIVAMLVHHKVVMSVPGYLATLAGVFGGGVFFGGACYQIGRGID